MGVEVARGCRVGVRVCICIWGITTLMLLCGVFMCVKGQVSGGWTGGGELGWGGGGEESSQGEGWSWVRGGLGLHEQVVDKKSGMND